MEESTRTAAKQEIEESLKIVLHSMQHLGFSFEKPKNTAAFVRQKIIFVLSVFGINCHVFTEFVYILLMFANTPSIENIVPLLHVFGYGVLCVAKVFAFWYKKSVFGKLVHELADIWPMPPLSDDAKNFKQKSLAALRITHKWYFTVNMLGVWFYNLTPIFIYCYQVWLGQEANIGFVWNTWYPFDKHRPMAHVCCYLFEVYSGLTCVWIMVSSDLLFSGMASHIALLLRILQRRFESLASTNKSDDENFEEIRSNIRLHQRLISYCNNLEEAFSLVNLINIVMSSIIICCAVFAIVLLEPILVLSNKLFLAAILIQVGSMCWYADDILHANADISAAVYNSGWYKTSPRCRRSLLFIILRSQKPIAFTAMKFTKISLITYSSILTRSYSYFALIYTMYSEK